MMFDQARRERVAVIVEGQRVFCSEDVIAGQTMMRLDPDGVPIREPQQKSAGENMTSTMTEENSVR